MTNDELWRKIAIIQGFTGYPEDKRGWPIGGSENWVEDMTSAWKLVDEVMSLHKFRPRLHFDGHQWGFAWDLNLTTFYDESPSRAIAFGYYALMEAYKP